MTNYLDHDLAELVRKTSIQIYLSMVMDDVTAALTTLSIASQLEGIFTESDKKELSVIAQQLAKINDMIQEKVNQ